jgi:GxxExxY protein
MTTTRDPEIYALIGAALAVHAGLGPGFLEAVYQEALALELAGRAIPHEREASLPVRYRGVVLRTRYRADFICYGAVVLELKAASSLSRHDDGQLVHYLKASGCHRGLLLNFGRLSLQSPHRQLGWNCGSYADYADYAEEVSPSYSPSRRESMGPCNSAESAQSA